MLLAVTQDVASPKWSLQKFLQLCGTAGQYGAEARVSDDCTTTHVANHNEDNKA